MAIETNGSSETEDEYDSSINNDNNWKQAADEEEGKVEEEEKEEEEEEPTICEICEACPCEWIEYGPSIVEHARTTYSDVDESTVNKEEVYPAIRYTCYQYYTYAKYGNLGKGIRMQPSKCILDKVFSMWPTEKRTGFKWSRKQISQHPELEEDNAELDSETPRDTEEEPKTPKAKTRKRRKKTTGSEEHSSPANI